MKIVAVSDLHGNLPRIPECDLLLLGGDLCPTTDHKPFAQMKFLDGPFREWLDSVPAKHVVGVAGNHDFIFERNADMVPADLRWTYLQDSGCEIDGVKIWGSPWQPPFNDWAFNADDGQRAVYWSQIPADVDIVVLHGPPRGYGDEVGPIWFGEPRRVGCELLLKRLEEIRPRLAVFGHIHGGYGRYEFGRGWLVNCSLVDEGYRPVNRPVELTLD